MSIEEKRRAAFESWALKNLYSIKRDGVVVDYANPRTDALWSALNAALDSVVIELPKAFETYGTLGFGGGDPDLSLDPDEVIKAIESAGLKVKS